MKRFISILMALCMLACTVVCAAEEAPIEGMHFTAAAGMLVQAGDTLDLAALLANPTDDVIFTTSDETVATVDEAGVVTAVADGIATIVAVSAGDTSVYAYMDVAVYNYLGLYSGSKLVEMMGCDIAVDITLNLDGTFAYYRAPLVINMEGGGEMHEIFDQGTFVVNGNEVVFTADELGEFSLMLTFVDGVACMTGKIPTGGPTTEMTIDQIEQADLTIEEEIVEDEAAEEGAEE